MTPGARGGWIITGLLVVATIAALAWFHLIMVASLVVVGLFVIAAVAR